MGLVNMAAGIGFLLLARRAPREAVQAAREEETLPTVPGFGSYAAVALLVGFAMMAVQAVLIRLGGLSLGSSPFTFAMVVAVFVLCIALGSLAVSLPARIPRAVIVINQWLLLLSLGALYLVLEDAPYWAHVLRSLLPQRAGGVSRLLVRRLPGSAGVPGPARRLLRCGAAASLPSPAPRGRGARRPGGTSLQLEHRRVVAGRPARGLPALLLAGSPRGLPDRARRRPGRGGTAERPRAGQGFDAGMGGPGGRRAGRRRAASRLAARALRSRSLPHARADPPHPRGSRRVLPRSRRAPRGAVLRGRRHQLDRGDLARRARSGALSIVNNGKSDGNLVVDYPTMALTGLVPALLAERPARAFVVGYGTGVTVGELAALPDVEEVVVAEISRGVLRAAPFFDSGNLGASTNPKVKLVRGDAYRVLLRTPGRFDVIASEPSNPWMAGVEMLYSAGVPPGSPGAAQPGRDLRPVVPRIRDRPRDRLHRPAHLRVGLRRRRHLVHAGTGPAPDRLRRGERGSVPAPGGARVFPALSGGAGPRRGRGHGGTPGARARPARCPAPLEGRRPGAHAAPSDPERSRRAGLLRRRLRRAPQLRPPARTPGPASATRFCVATCGRTAARSRRGDRARLADQLCRSRPNECAVALAEWLHDEPRSTELAKRIREARRRFGIQGPPLSAPFLRRLSRFFEADASGLAPCDPSRSPRRRRSSSPSITFRACPSSADTWTGSFDRCATDLESAPRCLEEREKAERQLGGLGAELGS